MVSSTPLLTRVAVVEDDALIRSSLQRIIDAAPGHRCVCVCATAEEALREIPRHMPHVVLMDIHLPTLSGIACTARLKQAWPALQVLMLTVYEDTERIFQALKAGASGYLLKRGDPDEILRAIREVKEGGAPMTSQIARKVVQSFREPAPAPRTEGLSDREREVLDFLAKGYTTKEIADKLSVSVNTVRTHLQHIYAKLHVRSRTEAVVKYLH
jgi:DNA-binding NarL/FixJ family response regulator